MEMLTLAEQEARNKENSSHWGEITAMDWATGVRLSNFKVWTREEAWAEVLKFRKSTPETSDKRNMIEVEKLTISTSGSYYETVFKEYR